MSRMRARNEKTTPLKCPHCGDSNALNNHSYKEGSIVTCWHDNCRKTFQQVNCPHCSGAVIWKNGDYKQGTVVTCPYDYCRRKFQQVNCSACSGSIFSINADYKRGDALTCPYQGCKVEFGGNGGSECLVAWEIDRPEFMNTSVCCPQLKFFCNRVFIRNINWGVRLSLHMK